jgi:uncharacterized membrane protein YfcA
MFSVVAEIAFGGFVVGLLIGLTGMGGGLVMTPLMIFLFGVKPSVAIGTDLIYASLTKIVGAWQHWKQKTVDFFAVRWLAVGSVPGALLGVLAVSLISRHTGQEVNQVMGRILGITYLLVAGLMIWRIVAKRKQPATQPAPSRWKMVVLGAVTGFLVGLTSVGSGTLIMAVLVMVYPISIAKLVGTDITQAVLVTGVAGLAHLSIGNVNLPLVANLLVGSIPGIWIGSKLTARLPEVAVRIGVIALLFFSGWKLLNVLG